MSAESIAPLGFDIDTSALVQGAKAADQLATALTGVATATDKVDAKSTEAAAEVRKVAEAEKQAAVSAEQFGKAVVEAVTAMTKEQEAAKRAAEELKKKADADKKAADAAKKAAEEEARRATFMGRLTESMRQMQGAAANSNQHVGTLSSTIGTLSGTMQGGAGGLSNGLSAAAGSLARFATIAGPVGGVVAGLTGGALALGGAYVGLTAALAAAQDKFALLEGRLKNIYKSGETAKLVFSDLIALSNKNGIAIEQTAESYLRLARNNEAIGLTRSKMLDLADAVQMLGRVSGASTGELAGAMMQFSQALASGRLNGDELRSIMENMPALAKAIADGMGVSVGQIRAMGAEGQLTGDKITKAILAQMPKIRKEFEGLPQTTEQAFTRVGNSWDELLAHMGERLNSSGVMQVLLRGADAVVKGVDDAIRAKTDAEKLGDMVNYGVGDMVKGAAVQSMLMVGSMGAYRPQLSLGPSEDEIAKQRAKVNAQRSGANMAGLQAAMDQEREVARAPYQAAQRVFDEVDPARKRVQELTSNMKQLTDVLELWKKRPELFNAQEVERIQRIPGYLASLTKQLNDALSPLEKFNRETINQRIDALKYGFGTDFGADIRKLTGTSVDGREVTEERARSSVVFQRTTALDAQTSAINQQIEAEKKRTETIGKGGVAEREAEASAKALQMQLEKFGTYTDAEVVKAVDNYKAALLELAKAQDAAAGKQALINAQIEMGAQKAASAALAAGGNAGVVADAERRARRAAELENAKPEMRPGLEEKYRAEDLQRANSEIAQLKRLQQQAANQNQLAQGMSPADARRMQQEQEARQFADGFAPAKQEAAYQAKLNELRAKDAVTIRQQLDEKLRSAELTQKEIALTAKGGLAAQVAIARERELNSIKASGLALTQAEVEARLKLAEQAVLDADALSKAQRTANAYVQMWQDAGQAVTSGLEQQFSKMLDGEKFKLKDFLEQIMKEITMAVIRAQIISPISNMFSDIGNGSAGGGGVLGGLVGSIAGSLKRGTASAAPPAAATAAANDNSVATAPLTRSLGSAAGTIAFPGGGSFATVGNYVARGAQNVDPRLADILKTAAERGGFDIQAYSGYRPGDPRFHGDKLAVDTRMLKNGVELPNYQNAESFRDYERYAQTARIVQMERYPELADQFRWGGYFSGPKGKYGAADLQHFDLGGGNGLGMAGGSWESGLTAAQRKLFPGAESKGIGDLFTKITDSLKGAEGPLSKVAPAMADMTKNAAAAAPALGDVGSSLGGIIAQLLQTGLTALLGHSSGGVISGGHSTTAYAGGGVVNKPTLFPMARGAGLMGEAGPEAILPLKRGTDGKLGVGGAQGGDSGVSVVVNDMRSGGQQVETQQERGGDGKRLIRLTIRDEVKGQMKNGTYDPEMRSQYGAGRVLARR